MPVDNCRVCGSVFFENPLLIYENMPKAAQYLPDAASLHLDRGADLSVVQCSACGLVQLDNDPVPYYREVIRAAAISREMTDFRRVQFGEFVEKYALKNKKIIEIGCGYGEYLAILQHCDVDPFGLEYSETAVHSCNANGLKAIQGFIESNTEKITDAPFDAFLILNFFEHLPDPNRTLAGISNNLTDDAVGMVEVPNFDMILQKNLFAEFISDHLFYFTRETLINTLSRNGFEVIECGEIWFDYIISATVRKRERLDISIFQQHQEKLKNQIADYLSRFADQKVAIWGAGHQALAVISLTDIGSRIKCVVDSAPFKQGKFTPASHVPIISPEDLYEAHVEAIIVMAASYSDEVARIIRKNYPPGMQVAILRDYGLKELE